MGEQDRSTGLSPFVHRAPHSEFASNVHYNDNPSHTKVVSPFNPLRNSSVPPLAPLDFLQSQRRGSITDPSLHAASPSRLTWSGNSTHSPSAAFEAQSVLRDPSYKHAPSESRPMSPYKFGEGSSRSPEHSNIQSASRRGSDDATAASSSIPSRRELGHEAFSETLAARGSKQNSPQALAHVSGEQGQSESRPSSMIGQSSQPPRGSGSPSQPHGTKRKLSHDRGVSNPGGDEIDPQLIGPGVPSSAGGDMEGPSPKRRGSMAGLAQNIFDRRHSLDARSSAAGPQWWPGDRRDSTSSMFSSPSMGYGSPAFSADSSHSHLPGGSTTFAMPVTQSPDQSQAMQSEGEASGSQSIDPNSAPRIAMASNLGFTTDRRMSVPTNLPSTMPPHPVANRVLRSRSRPPSRATGHVRDSEQPTSDPSGTQPAGDTDSGGPESASSSTQALRLGDAGMTPYSRSPELRVSHKLAERKRRKEMKDLFDELRDQLPADRGMKASKWEILSKAIDFIGQLKHGQQDMAREIDMLRHELESFRQGIPSFGPGGPHPSMYPPGSHTVPGHFPPPAGMSLPIQHPPPPNHQAAPHSASGPSSLDNAYHSEAVPVTDPPQNGDGSATSANEAETTAV